MDEGRVRKQEEDFTAAVDEQLPQALILSTSGRLRDAVEGLLPLEKKARIACDVASTTRVLVAIVTMCHDAQDWHALGEYVVLLSKRRGQLKQSVTKMVQKACEYLEVAPDKATMLRLLETLRTVTAGKIHVEIERARLTLKLAKIKEADGEIAEAADILQELQVETFGSMDRREKVEFILEQMRLGLLRKDFVRTQIISKKISVRFFEDTTTHDLKRKYYRQMIEVARNDNNYLEICKYNRALLDTPSVQADPLECRSVLQDVVLFAVLSPFSNEQSDLLARIQADPLLASLPEYAAIVQCMTTKEAQPWALFEARFGAVLHAAAAFSGANNTQLWTDIRKRVVEHSVRVIAGYYTRITTARMCSLLSLTQQECEDVLSSLVNSKTIFAKIDRPAGLVSFRAPQLPSDRLNDWASSTNSLMQLVDKATHVIAKEKIVHVQ